MTHDPSKLASQSAQHAVTACAYSVAWRCPLPAKDSESRYRAAMIGFFKGVPPAPPYVRLRRALHVANFT